MSDKDDVKIAASIDDILGDIELLIKESDAETPAGCISIWIPESYKDRFDVLQARTNKKFGKKIKELIILAIDRFEEKL